MLHIREVQKLADKNRKRVYFVTLTHMRTCVIKKHIALEPSKGILVIHAIWLLGIFCIPAIQTEAQVVAQEQERAVALVREHVLMDYVEVNMKIPGGTDSLCNLKFLEEWFIDPLQPSISKKVFEHDSACSDLWRNLAIKNGSISLRNISYEFQLLDPHLVASGNIAFPEPDSMDGPTRQLQEELIALITVRANFEERYQLEDQLLSVIFHEEWSQDPVTLKVTKRVRAITPVIWQRRQTETGDPVNEAETGLPVYYKNQMQQVKLRNP